MKTFTDSQQERTTNFIVYQTLDYKFGISLLYSTTQFPNIEKYTNMPSFVNIENTLYIHKARSLMQVPWAILHSEIYLFDQEKGFVTSEFPGQPAVARNLSIRFIICSYDPKVPFNPIIKFYDVEFKGPEFYPEYKLNTAKLISVNRLNLDTFNVNSMALIGNSTGLALGI